MMLKYIFFFMCTVVRAQSYLEDLEEFGYCVIPEVFSTSETEVLYKRVWHEFIEKAWPNCKMEDRSNWKEAFPIHNTMGIFPGPAGQIQVMWDLRQDPRIVSVFARIWNTEDLVVSMDGISFMCPTEIREGYVKPWPHVDQTILRRPDDTPHNNSPPAGFISESPLKTKPYTIQGQFLFTDSEEDDGGFYCIAKSHLYFSEFAPVLESLESGEEKQQFLDAFFGTENIRHVIAPRGSLILWDSRTLHWNQHANKNRSSPKVRMVGYLCYVPKARLTDACRILRKEAFDKGVSTGHNPVYPELKYSKDHIFQQFRHYLEDPSYIQQKIHLTPLGEFLLGL
jgi:hypothetical protein